MQLSPAAYKLTLSPIKDRECLAELGRRAIPKDLAKDYLQQCNLYSFKSKQSKTGLAFPNDKGGYEIRIPNSKLFLNEKFSYGEKAITFFPAHPDTPDVTALAFGQFWDFLAYLHIYGKRKDCSYCVYNGLIPAYAEQLRKDPPKRVLLAHSNDEAGKMESVALGDELEGLVAYGTLEQGYEGYKDLSAWRMKHPYVQHNQNRIQYAPRPQPAPKIS